MYGGAHLNSDHHIKMTLAVLFDNISDIVRLPGLLELATTNEIFDFSYGSYCIPVGISETGGGVTG